MRKFHLLFGLLRLRHPLRCAELASIDRKADEISFKGSRHLQFGILLSECGCMFILQTRERGKMRCLFFPLLSNAKKMQADCPWSERSRMFILQVCEKGEMRRLFFAFQYIYKFFTGNIGVHPDPLQLIQTLRQTLDNLVHPLIHRNGHIKTCFTRTCIR